MNPRIIKVKPLSNFTLEIEFANAELKIFDVKPYLHYPIYEILQGENIFLTAQVSLSTIVWNDDNDFCPDTLYLESKNLQVI
jgi:Protein of unknown function (DUF2442)